VIVQHKLPGGGVYTIVTPLSMREWEARGDDIQPDPEAAHFNSKHPMTVILGEKRAYCRKKGYKLSKKRVWKGRAWRGTRSRFGKPATT
jgi:hypothetical protein